MQAQGMKRYVSDHVVESIFAAAALGVALGVAIALALGTLLGGTGLPAAGTADTGAAVAVGGTSFGIAGSQGFVHESGALAGPGEGLNAGFVLEPGVAAVVVPNAAQARLDWIVGPFEGATATVTAGPAAVERIVGPGEGVMETVIAGPSAPVMRPTDRVEAIAGLQGATAPAARTQTSPPAGVGLQEFEPFTPHLTTPDVGPRIVGPGEGLFENLYDAASGSDRPTGPGEGLMGSGS
jgi:hypothetical protein